jgi:hypothetical protein
MASLVRFISCCVLLASALSLPACGGRSGDDEADSVGVGGAKGGGKGSGGKEGVGGAKTGGATGSGGTIAGGAGALGGTTSSGGTGSGGDVTVGDCRTPSWANCLAPPDSFVYFDEASGECLPSKGQCPGGDAKVFVSLSECLADCEGAIAGADVCDSENDCVLARPCCGPCYPVEISTLGAHHFSAPAPACPPVLCGPCPEAPELLQNMEYFRATCEDHVCTVVDITMGPSAECDQDDDCFLRDGAECCGSCDGSGYVPLSSIEYLMGQCDLVDCAACPLIEPWDVMATCDLNTGHCVKSPRPMP